MITILIFVVGLAIVAGVVGLMIRLERVDRRRIERRREAWKAEGCVGRCPGDDMPRSTPPHPRRLPLNPDPVAG